MKYLKLFEGFNTDEYYIKIDQSDFNDQSKPWKIEGLTPDDIN